MAAHDCYPSTRPTEKSNPNVFKKISGDGLSACIWELEVIHFEKRSWTKNILKSPNQPKYSQYLNDQLNITI